MEIISAFLFISFIASTIVACCYSALKNKQHLLVCDAFRKEFSFLPGGIVISQSGGIFLTFQKDLFFFLPLVLQKNRFIIRDIKPEHYDFIRSLPDEMTKWLKIKFLLLFISISLLISFLITNYLIVAP